MRLISKYGLKGKVRVNKSGCLDACEMGPTVVIYPDGVWYMGVSIEDVSKISEELVLKGEVVKRLLATDTIWNKLKEIRDKD